MCRSNFSSLAYLGYLPLALELVGRYLQKRPDLSLTDFWERLEGDGIKSEASKPLFSHSPKPCKQSVGSCDKYLEFNAAINTQPNHQRVDVYQWLDPQHELESLALDLTAAQKPLLCQLQFYQQ